MVWIIGVYKCWSNVDQNYAHNVLFLLFFSVLVLLAEDFSDNEELFSKDMTKWNSNDLMDKIETIEVDEAQGRESSKAASCSEINLGRDGEARASIHCTVID